MAWLLIDDERNLGCDVIARTDEGARLALQNCSWEGLCLDHDLGCKWSGYDILTWALERGLVPPIVELVTSNPAGRDRMGAALEANGYKKLAPHKYIIKGHDYA